MGQRRRHGQHELAGRGRDGRRHVDPLRRLEGRAEHDVVLDGAPALEEDARRLRVGLDVQVRPALGLPQVARRGARALAVLRGCLVVARAFLRGAVEVGVVRVPGLHTGVGEILAEPVTSSLYLAFVVPIPTLPLAIRIVSFVANVPPVKNVIGFGVAELAVPIASAPSEL